MNLSHWTVKREKAIVETDRGVSDRIELKIESSLAQSKCLGMEEMEEVQNLNQDDSVDAPM